MTLERFLAVNAPAAEAASRALTRMLHRPATVRLRAARFIGPSVRAAHKDPGAVVEALSFAIIGGLRGRALLCFPVPEARAVADILVGRLDGKSARLDALDDSAIEELGNIICGTYVSAISNALRVKVIPGVPRRSRGRFGTLFERLVAGCAADDEAPLLVEVELSLPEGVMMGDFLLCLESERAAEVADGEGGSLT